MRAVVTTIENPAPDIRVFRVETAMPLVYKAGQYVLIGANGLPARPYSIANAPSHSGRDSLEFHVKKGEGALSRHLSHTLREGDLIEIEGPMGDSVYEEGDVPLLAIAGGLGITPLKAIAEAALADQSRRKSSVTLFWGAASREEHYLDRYFRGLGAYAPLFSFHAVEGGSCGEIAAARFADLSRHRIHIAGSEAMILATLPLLAAKGARTGNIHYDRHPEAEISSPASEATPGTVSDSVSDAVSDTVSDTVSGPAAGKAGGS